jgi:hypothetical protein
MEASAREYGIFFSFGANPEIFRRMGEFNNEVGERRFNSQVLIRPQVSRSLCLWTPATMLAHPRSLGSTGNCASQRGRPDMIPPG